MASVLFACVTTAVLCFNTDALHAFKNKFSGYTSNTAWEGALSEGHFVDHSDFSRTGSTATKVASNHYQNNDESLQHVLAQQKTATFASEKFWEISTKQRCTFDSNCWKVDQNTAISNAIMYSRVTGWSCEDCLNSCLTHRHSPRPYKCRAAVFDHTFHICDLFAVSGLRWPQFLSRYDNRDFFMPIDCDPQKSSQGLPAATPPPTTAPSERAFIGVEGTQKSVIESVTRATWETKSQSQEEFPELEVRKPTYISPNTSVDFGFESSSSTGAQFQYPATDFLGTETEFDIQNATGLPTIDSIDKCSDGTGDKVARFCKFHDRELRGFSDVTLAVNSEMECISACAANEANQIQIINCHSFNYQNGQCVMSADDRETAGPITKSPGVSYFEKQCFPAKLAEGTGLVWTVIPGMILAGHVVEVTDALTLDDCKLHCLKAVFQCISAMWYPEDIDQNCILNSKDQNTVEEPESFGPEASGVPVFYVEIPRIRSSRRLKDAVLEQENEASGRRWTMWTSCSMTKNGISYRYMKCKERDIRNCPRDARRCSRRGGQFYSRMLTRVNSFGKEDGPCLAVVDHRNRKRCPHGIKKLKSGREVYCRRPVNCFQNDN